jgi:hypothetical protein
MKDIYFLQLNLPQIYYYVTKNLTPHFICLINIKLSMYSSVILTEHMLEYYILTLWPLKWTFK